MTSIPNSAEQAWAERLVALHATILERIAGREPLENVLDALMRAIEELASGMLASVLLADEDGKHLRHGSAPSLPVAYSDAIDGIEIGPVAGSCGTAAHRKQQVVVEDVMTDPLWVEFRALATEHNFRACWSTPICAIDGNLLGTFALYYRVPRLPDGPQLDLIDATTHLARTAIEHDRAERRLQLQNERLQFMADHDPLTGLANRRRFEQELDRHVALVERHDAGGALLLLDLDHFKYVNDAFGHAAGDTLIVSVADLLRKRLRATDVLARLGGDEFAVLLPYGGADDAIGVANDLLEAVSAHSVRVHGHARQVTTSIGVAPFEAGADVTGVGLLVRADLAMYDAKEAGRNRAVAFAPGSLDTPVGEPRATWVERIRQALELDRFVLFAQPVLPADPSRVSDRFELLLRMRSEDGEIVPPSAFLLVAERLDLIGEIDRWVVGAALDLLERCRDDRPDLSLEVNLSGHSVGDPVLLDLIESRLGRQQVDASRLVFEVTETGTIENFERAREFAHRLDDLGCRFALDDFGTGFGSFYYLKHLPFDYLKIDGEFVKRCLNSSVDQIVIESCVRLAHALGKQAIAEWVEDEATATLLRDHGVDFLQGYWIGRPQPAATVF